MIADWLDTRTAEEIATAERELRRLVRLFRAVESAWVLALYEDGGVRRRMIAELREALHPLPVLEISLLHTTPDPLALLSALPPDQQNAVVCFTDLGSGLDRGLGGYLDLQRESIRGHRQRLLFRVTQHDLVTFGKAAPNFYSRINSIFHFPGQLSYTLDGTQSSTRLGPEHRLKQSMERGEEYLPTRVLDKAELSWQIKLLQRRISTLEQMQPPEHQEIGASWEALGRLYSQFEPPDWNAAASSFTEASRAYATTGQQARVAGALYRAGEVMRRAYKYEQALDMLRQALMLYQESDDRLGEANALMVIGNVLEFRDERNVALDSYQQALVLFRDVGSKLGEAYALKTIGDVLEFRGEHDTALDNYQQALTLYRTVGSKLGEANALKAIGDVLEFRGEHDAALDGYQEALTLYRTVGSKLGEAKALKAIADVLWFRDERDAALDGYQQALTLYRAVGDHQGEADVLQAIGDVLQFRKERDAALDSYQQALALFRAVGYHLGEADVLQSIGDVLQFRKKLDAALARYDAALTLYRALGDRLGEANVLMEIGNVLRFRGERDTALDSYQQALALFRAMGDRLGEANVLASQNQLLIDSDMTQSLALLKQAEALRRTIGDVYGMGADQYNYGLALLNRGRPNEALPHLLRAREHFASLGLAADVRDTDALIALAPDDNFQPGTGEPES